MNYSFALKVTAVAVAASLSLAANGAVKDGTFEGTGMGRGGPITASVTFKSGKIADVKITKQTETAGVSAPALEKLPKQIVETNSIRLNAVSGATLTSKGILEAVGKAVTAAGGKPADFMKAPGKKAASKKAQNIKTEVLVIGGGASGITAAVRAATQGKKVILIEKMPNIGGDTQLNAGTLIATGSRYQREVMKETKDSPELAYKDIMRVGKNKNDPVLVKATTEKAGEVVDWLIYDMKIPYGPAATQYPDHSANRQLGVTGRSVNFLNLMSGILKKNGGVIMTDTRAQKFVTDKKGNVIGVKARMADGSTVNFSEKATILASGGYGANRNMLPKSVAKGLFYGLDSDSGDGLRMGRELGAGTINLDLVKQYPQGVETTPHHGLAATASSTDTIKKSGAIYVNTDGNRFVDELKGLGVLTDATKAQKNEIMYIVMDKAAWKEYVAKSLEDKLVASEADLDKWATIVNNGRPVMATSDKLEVAAKKMGINAANLQKTIDRWNGFVKAGSDKDFGRKNLKPLAEGPYYIVEQKVRFCTTLGGLKANKNMQILKKNGKPIGNLYGAGCVVGGANGADSMTAMMNSWAIISGYIAADSAVKSIK
ncbi:MAG: FAD-dependent oxidoreductase [Sutterellaceae bacterium]|nr:FAD-dependent oxidoreductase [Sutterellaceae bacterium]MDY2867583.1 FAD-dependent oxidoreductase [Mesosutterella sp.]